MPIPSSALVFRADYELATQYLAAYMGLLVDHARERGLSVVDLHAEQATKNNFFNTLESEDPLIVIAGGHGNETIFSGQNGEVVLEACQNDQVMAERDGIFNSCSVGVVLGPSMVDKTANLFVGYRADYLFMLEEPSPSNLFDDVYARPFMEAIIQPGWTRIDGGGRTQMFNTTVATFNYWINQWWNSDDPYAQDVISLLIHDRDNFMVSGVYTPALAAGSPLMLVVGLVASHFLFKFP